MSRKDYVLYLCSAVGEMNGSFGVAIRIGSSFNVESNKVIKALLTFPPAPDSMAREFLKALAKVSGIHYLGEGSFSFPQRFTDPECEQSVQFEMDIFSLTLPLGLQRS